MRKILASAGVMVTVAIGTTGTASAWPTPITPDMQQFLNSARSAGAQGSDDALLTQGLLACRILYTRQGVAAAEAASSPVIVRAARGTLCTQAPG